LEIIIKCHLKLLSSKSQVVNLTHELSTNTSSRQALLECEEKIRDLQKENSILRESNNKLLDSAYSVEVERQYHASENALKVLDLFELSDSIIFTFLFPYTFTETTYLMD
jgi:hypothetical protein